MIVDVVLEGKVVATYPFDDGTINESMLPESIAREAKECAIEDGHLPPEKAGKARIAIRQP